MIKLSTPIENYGKYGVAVYWLSDQLWCEKQLEFSLEYGEKQKEEEMAGIKRHKELHEEIAKLIPVKSRTIEDKIAIYLHNIQAGTVRLLNEGLTRELPIFGKVNSIFVSGMIDELRIKDGLIEILDHKTRKREKMPRMEQIIPSEFQLMLYYRLLQDCRLGKFDHKDLMSFYNFDSSNRISDEFEKEIISEGETIEPNIEKLSTVTFQLLKKIPEISKELMILYEYQKIRKLIGERKFTFNDKKFAEYINLVKGYWFGEREAIKVKRENSWKCNYCEFRKRCFVDKSQTTLFQF